VILGVRAEGESLQHRSKHLTYMRSWNDESLLRRP
jgi:hypothetical protein